MIDTERLIKAWEIFRDSNPYEICEGREFRAIKEPEYCMGQMIEDTLALLKKEQENLAKCVDQEHQVNEYLNRQLAERPEIIRCKDCKRYYANGGACDQVLSEWFCADGERK